MPAKIHGSLGETRTHNGPGSKPGSCTDLHYPRGHVWCAKSDSNRQQRGFKPLAYTDSAIRAEFWRRATESNRHRFRSATAFQAVPITIRDNSPKAVLTWAVSLFGASTSGLCRLVDPAVPLKLNEVVKVGEELNLTYQTTFRTLTVATIFVRLRSLTTPSMRSKALNYWWMGQDSNLHSRVCHKPTHCSGGRVRNRTVAHSRGQNRFRGGPHHHQGDSSMF